MQRRARFDADGGEIKRLDYGAVISDTVERTQAEADRLEELRAEQHPIPLQSAADCPSIARAFEAVGRSPGGIRIAGQHCPSVAAVRESLERFPQMGKALEGRKGETP